MEIAHIVPWEQAREHTFDKLIALCPTCHSRYDTGEIDRRAMQQYKTNLSVLNGRYGDLEKRVLLVFGGVPQLRQIWLLGGLDILLMNLLMDGFLKPTGRNSGAIMAGVPSRVEYEVTEAGREFVRRWLAAEELENPPGSA